MSQASTQSSLGSSGPVHRCGLNLNPEHASPHPMGCKSGPSADQNAFGRNRYNRGASQPQQPHKSNSSGRVKPLTPLLTRKKRMPSLRSVSRFWFIPGVKLANQTLHKAMPQRLCFDHHHKTLLFNRSLDQLPLRHATQAIHSMRLISINI